LKKVITRWIGKTRAVDRLIYDSDYELCINLEKYKGKKSDWEDGEWPPVKVTITVETAE